MAIGSESVDWQWADMAGHCVKPAGPCCVYTFRMILHEIFLVAWLHNIRCGRLGQSSSLEYPIDRSVECGASAIGVETQLFVMCYSSWQGKHRRLKKNTGLHCQLLCERS